jgi:hypothetical protein
MMRQLPKVRQQKTKITRSFRTTSEENLCKK